MVTAAGGVPAMAPGTMPVVAPLVGIFYRASSPGADPFVSVGDTVERGQTVCIIEAMKVMNEVTSDFRGTVVEILVENGEAVQYEQPLLLIDVGGAYSPYRVILTAGEGGSSASRLEERSFTSFRMTRRRESRREMMFRKILICNRGEIALRIIRTCRDMGIKTVQVYSKADADSRPVELADEAILIGPPAANRSYLHIPSIVHACLMTGAEAVHPGYGFLSQDTYFAEILRDSGIVFIGPPPEVMEAMGDKSAARRLMAEAGLPVPGGTEQPLVTADEARRRADVIGYPVILKASAGGGGRGMQVVWEPAALADALEDVRNTAQAVFKDNRVYLEKFIRDARHVEIQVMADRHGNVRIPRRARLLDPAPQPEADRGVPLDLHRRRPAPPHG